MPRYRVVWEVEVDADLATEAAARVFADVYCKPDAPEQIKVYMVDKYGDEREDTHICDLTPTQILAELLSSGKGTS